MPKPIFKRKTARKPLEYGPGHRFEGDSKYDPLYISPKAQADFHKGVANWKRKRALGGIVKEKNVFESFMVGEGESTTTKGLRYSALLWSVGLVGSKSWKPVVAAIALHVAIYYAVDKNIQGPSNVYSFLDGVMIARGQYPLAAPVALLNVYEGMYHANKTNVAHGMGTALGFFVEKVGLLR